MELNLKDKVAIVTGAARGIGRSSALTLGREGAAIVIDDIDLEAADIVVQQAGEAGINAMAFKADVTEMSEVKQLVEATLDNFGRIDILVNNVGILYGKDNMPGIHTLFEDSTEESWQAELDVTLHGVLNCTKAVVGTMLQQQSGSIVNIVSDAARGPQIDRITLYGAGKGGIIAFSKNLAHELGPRGIRVNCISPGTIRTTRMEAADAGIKSHPEAEKFLQERKASLAITPLRRVGMPQEIANVVAFLASDASSFITGQTLSVNGGRYMV
jgi:NAD(P)-dependent dehydrogenase (short-subunit alcohol dehydrogenase family)